MPAALECRCGTSTMVAGISAGIATLKYPLDGPRFASCSALAGATSNCTKYAASPSRPARLRRASLGAELTWPVRFVQLQVCSVRTASEGVAL